MQSFIEYSAKILPHLLEGMQRTLMLTAACAFFGTLLGILIALARIARNTPIRLIAGGYVTLFRGTPLLLQILFVWGALPQFGITLPDAICVVIAMSLNSGAYVAEIVRAAIQSIDKGQMEAARSIGMSYGLAMRRVILPQTFRRLLPPMVNEMAALTKDTSLAMVVGIVELMKASQQQQSMSFRPAETYVWTALGYLLVTITLMTLASHFEKKLEARG
ncbi:MAG TPA: amino acid ABC transporter permease [Symbiobacteriaceae bacterium]|nr:amino acid ABC transporter permease [Symbiobacteriaceae bacterium]